MIVYGGGYVCYRNKYTIIVIIEIVKIVGIVQSKSVLVHNSVQFINVFFTVNKTLLAQA